MVDKALCSSKNILHLFQIWFMLFQLLVAKCCENSILQATRDIWQTQKLQALCWKKNEQIQQATNQQRTKA